MELKPVEKTYSEKFFVNRYKLSWRAPIVCKSIIDTFKLSEILTPIQNQVIDIGCGIGDYVHWFNQNGLNAFGIEGSAVAAKYMVTRSFMIWDMRLPFTSDFINFKKYQVLICFEVVEHIEEEFINDFIDNLIMLSDTILISAASPGQKGHGHVNCRKRKYWIDLFEKKGFMNSILTEHNWRKNLKKYQEQEFGTCKKELKSYYNNAICFKRETLI